jgi:molecular chaperone DnaK (HSP70)
VQQDIVYFPFKVIEKNSKPMIKINVGQQEKYLTPEEIYAMILGKMRQIAVSRVFIFVSLSPNDIYFY